MALCMALNSPESSYKRRRGGIYPNLLTVRFHDLRHTAITVMAEAGLPDQTIMAQVGHISPEMIKPYSHIRRQALNAAAAVLELAFLKPQTTSAEMVARGFEPPTSRSRMIGAAKT